MIAKVSTCPKYTARERKERLDKQKRAVSAVNQAVKAGTLIRPELCSACVSSPPYDAHHDDYDQPLTVRWLCRKCHGRHHRQHELYRQGATAYAPA